MADGFVFYRSYYEAGEKLPPRERSKFNDAIIKYAFTGEESKLSGMAEIAWILVKPNLDAAMKRKNDGEKGGRPRKKPGEELSLQEKRFEEFWKQYPRKVGKGDARKKWMRIEPNDELFHRILSAVEAAKKSEQWQRDNGQFIPHPATWLNQGRWDDELGNTAGRSNQPSSNPFWDLVQSGELDE